MTPAEAAFLDADFRWVSTLPSVWRDNPSHVDGLQEDVADRIMAAFAALRPEAAETVTGQVVNGPAGSGKTHLIGTLRRRVWEAGGWFVLIDIVGITDFWRTAAFGFVNSLLKPMADGRPQHRAVFLAALKRVSPDMLREMGQSLSNGAVGMVNLFVRALQEASPEAMRHSNVVRAVLLLSDPGSAETAYDWLQGIEIEAADRKALGLTAPSPRPDALVAGCCWLMSLGGPVMIAVDQIDAIVTAGNIVADSTAGLDDETEARARGISQILGGGLMDLFDQTPRAMTVVTCLSETWSVLRQRALQSALHRFVRTPLLLNSVTSSAAAVAELIGRRLAPAYERRGASPAVPTWPFLPEALAELEGHWPREILMRCETYRLNCLDAGHVPTCTAFTAQAASTLAAPDLTARFAEFRAAAAVDALMAEPDEAGLLGACLRDALGLYVRQLTLPNTVDAAVTALMSDPRPPLHARLTFTFQDQLGLEKHYCVRVIAHSNARAVQSRLRAAMTDAGIDRKLPFRHLFVIRNAAWPGGAVTKRLTDEFASNGGAVVALAEDELRILVALRDMDAAKIDGFDAWLREHTPLCDTALFRSLGLCPPPLSLAEILPQTPPPPLAEPTPRPATIPAPSPPASQPAAALTLTGDIPLGVRVQGGGVGPPVALPVSLLTRHVAIFAGSGSGKTVLLRRLVEEAALRGVPAIVLDTNNDLARLGMARPKRPGLFTEADADVAARYHRDVEVVVWTPGVAAGRPLTLPVLPDFAGLGDGDARQEAVDMAWATLAPLVAARGAGKALKDGVLKEALTAFAQERQNGTGKPAIGAFIDYLADLPFEVSRQTKAARLAEEMADQLRAKLALNPLLSAPGEPLDPAALFTASRPGATRISVINLAGLGDDNRQDFVNQLQMALFTFIRRQPSATPRLYVVDEAQNFAPSQATTASKASLKALATQARKFGLGLVVATQAPKGIDTNIVSNCTTHFYGRMSSPALIEATEAMMAAKGRAAKDLGSLTAGLFYMATEGLPQPVKLKTPLCLSWHPQNPATPEEIVTLARPSAADREAL